MNYPESQLILEEIKKAKKILLNCHKTPDPDSIGCALALRKVLKNFDKEVKIICPSQSLYKNVNYLEGYKEIEKSVNFSEFDFTNYDLFITLDSASMSQITGFNGIKIENIKLISIDHHLTNTRYAEINLVDDKVTSTGELLYLIFEDWKIKFDSDMANCLMAGIVGDTGAFRYPGSNERTFKIASELIKFGAEKDKAVHALYRSEPFELIKFYGEVLSKSEIDTVRKFVWSAIPYEIYKKLGRPAMAKESSASLFSQIVEGTDFGFVAVELEKNKLGVSFRSRTGLDISKFASKFGGGGHIYAAGCSIENTPFDQAVEILLTTVRRMIDEKKV